MPDSLQQTLVQRAMARDAKQGISAPLPMSYAAFPAELPDMGELGDLIKEYAQIDTPPPNGQAPIPQYGMAFKQPKAGGVLSDLLSKAGLKSVIGEPLSTLEQNLLNHFSNLLPK